MSKQKISVPLRVALWRSNEKKCFYCSELISFIDVEIDHLIAESTKKDRLDLLISKIDLPRDFSVENTMNLVPTHHGCNRRKSNLEFSESSLRYYFELWKKKQSTIQREISSFNRQSKNEEILTSLAGRIDEGYLSLQEVIRFLQSSLSKYSSKPSEPIVVTFGVDVSSVDINTIANGELKNDIQLYEWLESYLLRSIRKNIPSLSSHIGISERSGETISMRIAFWNLDMTALEASKIDFWHILEIAPYSEIYEDDWDDLFARSIVETYHMIIKDPEDPRFGLGLCPGCASRNLKRSTTTDYARDEIYYLIQCLDCGWSDWTQ